MCMLLSYIHIIHTHIHMYMYTVYVYVYASLVSLSFAFTRVACADVAATLARQASLSEKHTIQRRDPFATTQRWHPSSFFVFFFFFCCCCWQVCVSLFLHLRVLCFIPARSRVCCVAFEICVLLFFSNVLPISQVSFERMKICSWIWFSVIKTHIGRGFQRNFEIITKNSNPCLL